MISSTFFRSVILTTTVLSSVSHGNAAEELEVTAVSVGSDKRLRIEMPTDPQKYYVLYNNRDPDKGFGEPVSVFAGGEGRTILSEPLGLHPVSGFYRVEELDLGNSGDLDGDGLNDAAELGQMSTGRLAPLNAADPIAFVNGTCLIADRQMFRDLSYQGLEVVIDTHLESLEFVKFYILEADTDRVRQNGLTMKTSRSSSLRDLDMTKDEQELVPPGPIDDV